MPISQGSAGGLVGMTLKAWGHIKGGAAPAVIKGFNVSGAAVSGTATRVTFANAMASANFIVRAYGYVAGSAYAFSYSQTANNADIMAVTETGSLTTCDQFYFEVWE